MPICFGGQDITQAGQAEGVLVDSSTNLTSKSIPSALITLAVRGSDAIFGRPSASSFYIEVEQLSVMHFLDSIRFQAVLALIRSNSAYIVSNNVATGRPHIEFTQVMVCELGCSCERHVRCDGF